MNEQKPNTPAQKAADEIFRQDAKSRGQKEIDQAVSELDSPAGRKEAAEIRAAEKSPAVAEKLRGEMLKSLEARLKGASGGKSEAKTAEQEGEDTNYYNGMSQ